MNNDEVKALLDIYHATLELPQLKNIMMDALSQLREIDASLVDEPEVISPKATPSTPTAKRV